MKTYTITSQQLTECLAALAYGEACLANNGRESATLSKTDIIKKLQKAQKELSVIEFSG